MKTKINSHTIMKSMLKITMVAFLLFGTFSCDDVLDEQPISQIGNENFWLDNNDARSGITALYDALQPTYRIKHFLWGEFRSDNFGPGSESASSDNLELVFNNLTAGNGNAVRWRDMYIAISRANQAIARIPEISGFDQNLLAEAYIIRAYLYFDAIRVWGDVPLYTEPIEELGTDFTRPQTDGNTILNEIIIPDMLEAERLMTNFSDKFRFSLTSIWAFQAKVYMWTQQYDLAKTALEKVIDSGEFQLVTTPETWQDLFLNDIQEGGPGKIQEGPELILSLKFDLSEPRDNPGQTRANRNGIFALFFAGLPSYYLAPELEEKWRAKFPIDQEGWETRYPDTDPVITITNDEGEQEFIYGDWRYYLSREDEIDGDFDVLGESRLAKYNKANYSQDLDDSDLNLFRYSDMILLLAEAENQLNNDTRSLELVNQLRTARQLPLVTADEFGSTIAERENYILDERQLELLGEGIRWWDLVRTGKAIEIMNPILQTRDGSKPLTEQLLLWPVWFEHIIENDELEQTPGY